MSRIVAYNVPLKGLTEKSDINSWKAKVNYGQGLKDCWQKLQQDVLEHCNQITN